MGRTFEDCKISGLIKAAKNTGGMAVFHGLKYALRRRLYSIRTLFRKGYSPVKFIHCDLTGLQTESVFFEKEVVFKDHRRLYWHARF